MARTRQQTTQRLGQIIRSVTVVLIAGVLRWRSAKDIEAAYKERSFAQQVTISVGVLGLLFGLSLFSAQFGWLGILLFWLAVIAIAN